MYLYSLAIFLSSFLSFSLQLMIGKIILPWFGGVATVWSTLLFFYTSFLLAGYFYVSKLTQQSAHKQRKFHNILIIIVSISLFFSIIVFHKLFPSAPFSFLTSFSSPSLQIIFLSLICVGLPYFLLTTTSTLLQVWFSSNHPQKSPYFLYNISNIGSFLGLVSYPFLIEPNLTLKHQELSWISFYIIYLFLYLKITNKKLKNSPNTASSLKSSNYPIFIVWTLLSSISNISLLATTSYITQSITPIPLLWILPLALFLLSFILAFSEKFYQRGFHIGLLFVSILITFSSFKYIAINNFFILTGLIIFTQFMINLVSHSELYKLRPKSKNLVTFYISISLGGVVGSFFCAILAPTIFKEYWEFPISLVLGGFLYLIVAFNNSTSFFQKLQHIILCSLLIFISLKYFEKFNTKFLYSNTNNKYTYSNRNFYGTIKIVEGKLDKNKVLYNGNISHGSQVENVFSPTTYYQKNSGVGTYISALKSNNPKKSIRMGVIGLGVGTMASYCERGDYIRFYDINPLVIDINNKYFTFLKHCNDLGGATDIVLGDARISLQNELNQNSQRLDVLVVDAFTDDAIPTHLITKEALNLFLNHLSPNGIVAYHISNIYLELDKVLDSVAKSQNLYVYQHITNESKWYLISRSLVQPLTFNLIDPALQTIPEWTDDFSNLLSVLKK